MRLNVHPFGQPHAEGEMECLAGFDARELCQRRQLRSHAAQLRVSQSAEQEQPGRREKDAPHLHLSRVGEAFLTSCPAAAWQARPPRAAGE